MNHTRKQMVEMEVTTHTTCDLCGKTIPEGTGYHIRTGHRGWGNDSCDSWESWDGCSIGCLKAIVCKRNEENKRYDGANCEIEMGAEAAIQLANALAEGIKA